MAKRILTSAAAVLIGTAIAANAHDQKIAAAGAGPELFQPSAGIARDKAAADIKVVPPLYLGIGDLSIPISTKIPQVQAYFDQGLRLAWAFNHEEARRSFRHALALDPNCAMCAWGEAWVLGTNINDPMHEEAIEPALAAVQMAVKLKANATDKEQALIDALAKRYGEAGADLAALEAAFADAMGDVAKRWPDDANIQAIHAEAMMNTQPWDYWEADKKTPKGRGGAIVAALEKALALDPNHIGASHLYIHAVEASSTPERAEPYADRLRGSAPNAGHLVHMPSHIYIRIGRYDDAIKANADAVVADEKLLAALDEVVSPLYRFGYYPHNLHFLLVNAQFAGRADLVIPAAEKLGGLINEELAALYGVVQAVKTAPYVAHAQFSDSATILGLADPGARFPFVQGFWRYARGVAHLRSRDFAAAQAEADQISVLIEKSDFKMLEDQYLPARAILDLARNVIEARIAQASGDYETAIAKLQKAAETQDAVPYMEPAYWYYPVRQTLGAVLLQAGKTAEAEAVFKQALVEQPRNGTSLWGLMQAQTALGQTEAAAATKAELDRAWQGGAEPLDLDRL